MNCIYLHEYPDERTLLSYVDGQHRFYAEPDRRVIVADDSGIRGEPGSPFYLAAAPWHFMKDGTVAVRITNVAGDDLSTIESAAGAYKLADALWARGYHVEVRYKHVADIVRLAKRFGVGEVT